MRRSALKTSIIAIGALIPVLIVGVAGKAMSQQRPISVSDWLKAERNNANMQRAVEEYERAQFNSAPPQQQRYPQPAQRAQAQAPNAQAPRQWTPPADQQAQVTPPAGGELPQRENEQNTYKVPDDALEKIDKQFGGPGNDAGGQSSGFYVAANIGIPFVDDQEAVENGLEGSLSYSLLAVHAAGAAGYKVSDWLSLEMLGSYQYAEDEVAASNGDISVTALLANARLEIGGSERYVPYLSAGLGTARLALDLTSVSTSANFNDSDFVMAYQIGMGAIFPLDDRTSVDFAYKFFGTTDADMESGGTTISTGFSSHTFMLGLKHML